MSLITWSDSLSLNIEEIDKQHKKLVNIVNELYQGMLNGESKAALGIALNQLYEYTKLHFSFEESLMSQYGYQGTEEHKANHHMFINKLEKLKVNVSCGYTMLGMEMISFLRLWITEHIMKDDKSYAEYISCCSSSKSNEIKSEDSVLKCVTV